MAYHGTMTNSTFDKLKWTALIAIPALATLIGAVGVIWGLDLEPIVLTVTAVGTFAGALLGVSNANYNRGKHAAEE